MVRGRDDARARNRHGKRVETYAEAGILRASGSEIAIGEAAEGAATIRDCEGMAPHCGLDVAECTVLALRTGPSGGKQVPQQVQTDVTPRWHRDTTTLRGSREPR